MKKKIRLSEMRRCPHPTKLAKLIHFWGGSLGDGLGGGAERMLLLCDVGGSVLLGTLWWISWP